MILIRLKTFIKSLWFHVWSGFPKCNHQQILERYKICLSCDSYDILDSTCGECGCNINMKKQFLNKLAWADQECPLKKWGKVHHAKNLS
jgi:ssDNA-binding Zn-finger/Zn-ribbon topoisomerase 1